VNELVRLDKEILNPRQRMNEGERGSDAKRTQCDACSFDLREAQSHMVPLGVSKSLGKEEKSRGANVFESRQNCSKTGQITVEVIGM
jgi:hypothetical protein